MGWNEDLASCTWMFPEVTSGGAVLISPSVVDLGLTFSLTTLVRFNISEILVLNKGTTFTCSTLAWKIPWMGEPGRLQSMGSRRVGHDWVTSLSLFTFMHWRRKWQPTPVFLPWESQGWRSLVGCCLWCRRVGHDWSNLAAAAMLRFGGKYWKLWSWLTIKPRTTKTAVLFF